MRRELYVPPQSIQEGLIVERAGAPFLLKFPKVIPEQPYLGQVYQLSSISLVLTHTVVLKVGQEEAFPSSLACSLQLLRNNWIVGVWELSFQMRLLPGTEGKRWFGEATVFQDLVNPVDYRSGDTLTFVIAGVVPGNIGGPQLTKQEERELERIEREIESLTVQSQSLEISEESLNAQAEILNGILDLQSQTGEISDETLFLLEQILNRLFEMG